MTCTINCNHTIAATLYTTETWFVVGIDLWIPCIKIVHNNNKNTHNNKIIMPQILFFLYKVYVASLCSEFAVKQRIFHFWCPTWTWNCPSQRPLLRNRRHKVRECTSTHTHTRARARLLQACEQSSPGGHYLDHYTDYWNLCNAISDSIRHIRQCCMAYLQYIISEVWMKDWIMQSRLETLTGKRQFLVLWTVQKSEWNSEHYGPWRQPLCLYLPQPSLDTVCSENPFKKYSLKKVAWLTNNLL